MIIAPSLYGGLRLTLRDAEYLKHALGELAGAWNEHGIVPTDEAQAYHDALVAHVEKTRIALAAT